MFEKTAVFIEETAVEYAIFINFNDTHRENCFIQFNTRIYWNRSLAASDLFDMFTQSVIVLITFCCLVTY